MNNNNLATPIAIVIAGALVGLGLFFAGGSAPLGDGNNSGSEFGNNGSGAASDIRRVGEDDHVFGNPDAKVTIIEFSDYECPFCARFHPTVERVVEESNGQVNWVYRHFPLSSIHANATNAAIAAECVADLAGNDAFWSFSETLLENYSNLSLELYTQAASALGVDTNAFSSCVTDGAIAERVETDYNEAISAGGRGTPFSVIVSKSGKLFPFSGALPYEQLKKAVEEALEN